jgi:hypothetical protein
MDDFLDKLVALALGQSEDIGPQPNAIWYMVSDNLTNIKGQDFMTHPCLLRNAGELKSGFVFLWIRSASGVGEIPNFIPHLAHTHDKGSRCPLTKDAVINVVRPRKVPSRYIMNLKHSCVEKDQGWLKAFARCHEQIAETQNVL